MIWGSDLGSAQPTTIGPRITPPERDTAIPLQIRGQISWDIQPPTRASILKNQHVLGNDQAEPKPEQLKKINTEPSPLPPTRNACTPTLRLQEQLLNSNTGSIHLYNTYGVITSIDESQYIATSYCCIMAYMPKLRMNNWMRNNGNISGT